MHNIDWMKTTKPENHLDEYFPYFDFLEVILFFLVMLYFLQQIPIISILHYYAIQLHIICSLWLTTDCQMPHQWMLPCKLWCSCCSWLMRVSSLHWSSYPFLCRRARPSWLSSGHIPCYPRSVALDRRWNRCPRQVSSRRQNYLRLFIWYPLSSFSFNINLCS